MQNPPLQNKKVTKVWILLLICNLAELFCGKKMTIHQVCQSSFFNSLVSVANSFATFKRISCHNIYMKLNMSLSAKILKDFYKLERTVSSKRIYLLCAEWHYGTAVKTCLLSLKEAWQYLWEKKKQIFLKIKSNFSVYHYVWQKFIIKIKKLN